MRCTATGLARRREISVHNRPENTTQRDMALHVLGSIGTGGPSGYILEMEAAGKQQVVASDSLPTDARPDEEALTALGFVFGEPYAEDPLFRPATLPEGWRKEPHPSHDMWSYVVDEHGRRRVAVFYKAAFYDRGAHMRLESTYSYANELVDTGAEPVFDDWCTREQLVVELEQLATNLRGRDSDHAEQALGATEALLARVRNGA